jgi:hypothetical protein
MTPQYKARRAKKQAERKAAQKAKRAAHEPEPKIALTGSRRLGG